MPRNPFIAVRVPPEIIKSLDEIAKERGVSRSTVVRELLANCHSFHRFIESEKTKQKADTIVLDGNLSRWIKENMQDNMPPEWLHFVAQAMHHVADDLAIQKGRKQDQK